MAFVAPSSGHLIVGNYLGGPGRSGSLYAVDLETGTVTGHYRFPVVTDRSGLSVMYGVRDLARNPSSRLGDERFVVTPDVFPIAGGHYPTSPLTEVSYDATGGTFTLKSPPMVPFTMPGLPYALNYNLVQYDGEGNLWCPTHGGVGLGVFTGVVEDPARRRECALGQQRDRVTAGAGGHTRPTKGAIVGGRLYNGYQTSTLSRTGNVGLRLPQWLVSTALRAF